MKIEINYRVVCILIIVIVMSIYFLRRPSKIEMMNVRNEFAEVISNSDKIEKIEVYYGWEKLFIITDKKIINEICMAIKENYGEESVFNGGYSDWYLIRLKLKNKWYSFRYYKSINHYDKCTQQVSKNGIDIYKNPWNDCGQLILLKDQNCAEEKISMGCSKGVVILRNIDLIPLLREYVDPFVKKK